MEEEEGRIVKRPSTYPIFSKHLALQPMTVVDFANECKKQYEEFNEAFKRRIMIELQYARNLQAVSKSLDKHIQPGTQKAISFICSAFKVENQQRAHQAKQLAQSLRTQIYQICSNACKQQTALIKRVQKDVKKYVKQFESLQENLERTYQSYEKVSQDTQQLIITKNFLKYTSEIPQQKKAKLISKTMDSIKEKKQYEKLYLSANKNYNQFVREYNKTIAQDLNQVEHQIREQIILQGDCLRKLIVCEVSMFKNIEYDLINISKQMQALDTQKDVQVVVQMNLNSTQNLIVDPDQYKKTTSPKQKRKSIISDKSSTISAQDQTVKQLKQKQSQVDKGMMAICLKHVEEQVFSSKIMNKKNKQFKELIEFRWSELNSVAEPQVESRDVVENKQVSQLGNDGKQQEGQQEGEQARQQAGQQAGQNSIKEENKVQVETLRQKFDKYFVGSQVSKEFLHSKKQEQKPQTINEVYDNFFIITRYINQIWNSQNPTMIESKKKSKQPESPFLHIKKILSLSHFYRVVSYSYIQSFRVHHKVMIQSPERARQIAKFINSLLTKSAKENDIFILRGLLGLIFTYYWIDNNNKKHMYIENSVYKNSLWKKHDFWDSAIFEVTFQEMLSFGPQKGQSFQETILREKNLIFSQLASYCHYMIMLGIGSKNVRQIVGRYCRLYEMNDDQNRDLSKMITNTIKQYKQIVSTYIKDGKDPKQEKTND